MLVEYTVALVEYTRLYKPYRKANDYLEELLREQEDDDKQAQVDKDAQLEEKDKVSSFQFQFIFCHYSCTSLQDI